VIGFKISRHFLNQSDVEANPIVTRWHLFSRALRQLHVITASFDWFTGLSVSFVTGQCNGIGFGFETSRRRQMNHSLKAFLERKDVLYENNQ